VYEAELVGLPTASPPSSVAYASSGQNTGSPTNRCDPQTHGSTVPVWEEEDGGGRTGGGGEEKRGEKGGKKGGGG
jgi:hypothetical protein